MMAAALVKCKDRLIFNRFNVWSVIFCKYFPEINEVVFYLKTLKLSKNRQKWNSYRQSLLKIPVIGKKYIFWSVPHSALILIIKTDKDCLLLKISGKVEDPSLSYGPLNIYFVLVILTKVIIFECRLWLTEMWLQTKVSWSFYQIEHFLKNSNLSQNIIKWRQSL